MQRKSFGTAKETSNKPKSNYRKGENICPLYMYISHKGLISQIHNSIVKKQIGSLQLLSHVRLSATPWTAAHQVSLSITDSQSPPKPMSIESVMPSNHLILCCPLLLLPSIFPSIRVFSSESALHIRWPNIGVSASKSVLQNK